MYEMTCMYLNFLWNFLLYVSELSIILYHLFFLLYIFSFFHFGFSFFFLPIFSIFFYFFLYSGEVFENVYFIILYISSYLISLHFVLFFFLAFYYSSILIHWCTKYIDYEILGKNTIVNRQNSLYKRKIKAVL